MKTLTALISTVPAPENDAYAGCQLPHLEGTKRGGSRLGPRKGSMSPFGLVDRPGLLHQLDQVVLLDLVDPADPVRGQLPVLDQPLDGPHVLLEDGGHLLGGVQGSDRVVWRGRECLLCHAPKNSVAGRIVAIKKRRESVDG